MNKRDKKANSHLHFENYGKHLLKCKCSNSHLHSNHMNQLLECKRSQVTVFVILAIAIVAVLMILLFPSVWKGVFPSAPDAELSSCLKENVQDALEQVMLRGGSVNPGLYYVYGGEKLGYLCYTREYFKTCIMQNPLLKQTIEKEIEASIQPAVKDCIKSMKDNLESQGYSLTSSGAEKASVQIIPDNVKVSVDMTITAKKETETTYKGFNADFSSKSYDLIMTASSIQNWEARYGDASIDIYAGYYPNIKVEKKKQSDGTTIYIITHRLTAEKLQFASRSIAWPAGYAV